MNAFNRSLTTSSRRFDNTIESQAVGLGIVAAMSTISNTTTLTDRIPAAKMLLSGAMSTTRPILIGGRRTKSIPIQSSSKERVFGFEDEVVMEMVLDMDMEESYTCVTGKIRNDKVRKREYFDDRVVVARGGGGIFSRSLVADVVESQETSFWGGADFLSSCFLCRKDLRGIDIFMYRGEKAFCSVECRDVQIATDKLKEKCGRVRVRSMEHSESPCCSPMLSYTGVVAA